MATVTAEVRVSATGARVASHPAWLVVQGGAAMAAAMGVGRFVYTPILPLMQAQAGLTPQMGAHLATANYVGYFAGALATIVQPALGRSRTSLRVALLVLIASLALMPATHSEQGWLALRYLAGFTSAVIFVIAAGALLGGLKEHGSHLVGWGFGGVGVGIAASGALVLAVRDSGTWEEAWWGSAVLALLCAGVAWRLPLYSPPAAPEPGSSGGRRWFAALLTSYTLEGVGYIIAGTFLVAAINQSAPGWVGTGAWVLVGLAALPSAALWAFLSRTWSRPGLILTALCIQAVGVLLPALFSGAAVALVAAALFGATFLGIAMMSLGAGSHLRVPHAVALLTTGYSVGQIAGPLVVTPMLDGGYRGALAVSAGIVVASALAAAMLRIGFPHHLGPLPSRVPAGQSRDV